MAEGITKPKRRQPVAQLRTVLGKLEGLQQRVDDSADNCDINSAKDTLMRLLSRWEST